MPQLGHQLLNPVFLLQLEPLHICDSDSDIYVIVLYSKINSNNMTRWSLHCQPQINHEPFQQFLHHRRIKINPH